MAKHSRTATTERRGKMQRAAQKRVAAMKGKFRICPEHGRVRATAWGAHCRYQHPAKSIKPVKPGIQRVSPKTLQQLILVGITQSDVVLKTDGRELPIAAFMHGGSAEELAKLLRSAFAGKPPGTLP